MSSKSLVAQIKDETGLREMKQETNLVKGGTSKREEERDQSGSGEGGVVRERRDRELIELHVLLIRSSSQIPVYL